MRVLAVVLVALILSAPAADAGTNLAHKVAQALTIAKRADKRSRKAIAAVAPSVRGPEGERGLEGRDGATGRPGVDGPKGQAGATGATGATGVQGAAGSQGPAGENASAAVNVTTGTNATDVRLGAVFTTQEESVVAVTVQPSTAGRVMAEMDGEVTETRGFPTPVECVLRVDGNDEATRDFDLAASAHATVAVSAAPFLTAGTHDVRVSCHRVDGRTDAIPAFPAGRSRLTVVG